jgi:hypothetical protein
MTREVRGVGAPDITVDWTVRENAWVQGRLLESRVGGAVEGKYKPRAER